MSLKRMTMLFVPSMQKYRQRGRHVCVARRRHISLERGRVSFIARTDKITDREKEISHKWYDVTRRTRKASLSRRRLLLLPPAPFLLVSRTIEHNRAHTETARARARGRKDNPERGESGKTSQWHGQQQQQQRRQQQH